MEASLQSFLSQLLDAPIQGMRPLSGGDISAVYAVNAGRETYLVKANRGANALAMFEAEQAGLHALARSGTLRIPRVRAREPYKGGAVLVMEFIASRSARPADMRELGRRLARLHLCSHERFGFPSDNFIGSLPQSNGWRADWPTFYARERLLPQLAMAVQNGRLPKAECPDEARLLRVCQSHFPAVSPALLHGDLWGGNFLIAENGEPVLIDPAVYYGHGEVDLAMSRLFGGFTSDFYDAYHELHPPQPGADARRDLYQLYYLLVHLNLFGRGYYPGVSRILNRYC